LCSSCDLFFLHSSHGVPRDLHSFPTRRSSDLEFLQTGGRPAFMIRAVLAATLSSVYGIYSGFELCEGTPLPGREEYMDSEKYQLDRKSTRLNSSHVKISYAVFCLKKKKKNKQK